MWPAGAWTSGATTATCSAGRLSGVRRSFWAAVQITADVMLAQQRFLLPQLWRPEVWDRGAARLVASRALWGSPLGSSLPPPGVASGPLRSSARGRHRFLLHHRVASSPWPCVGSLSPVSDLPLVLGPTLIL